MQAIHLKVTDDQVQDIRQGINAFNEISDRRKRADFAELEVLETEPENEYGTTWVNINIHVHEIYHLFYIGRYVEMKLQSEIIN